jgi:20S proteasome alpha/beta subunit
MTVLVGVCCKDGIVIGADSATTSTAGHQRTLQETGVAKIEIHYGEIITAATGAVGLAQRFREELTTMLQGKELAAFRNKSAVRCATDLSHRTMQNFQKTLSPLQQNPNHGLGLGALVAFVSENKPQLVEFDHLQFHPEVKGVSAADGKPRTRPYVTMGSGQVMADPFIAHVHRMLFGNGKVPTLSEGRLLVAWTLQHVISYNTGGVAGDLQMAVLEKQDNKWVAHTSDCGEVAQQVTDIESYIGRYWEPPAQPALDLRQQIEAAPGAPEAGAAAAVLADP